MQVTFTIWSTGKERRVPVSVNPKRVDCVEFVSAPQQVRAAVWTDDTTRYMYDDMLEAPACTKIIMMGKHEYWVQGTVEEVTEALNKQEG